MMTDDTQINVNKLAGLILKMYLKDKRSGNGGYKLPAKKKEAKNNVLFDS